jgi:peptidoglycan/LPS O-acetylase OafA/YrhL
LSHSVAIWLCFAFWPTRWAALNLLESVALTGTISVATFHLLEQPGIEFGKRVAERWGMASFRAELVRGAKLS